MIEMADPAARPVWIRPGGLGTPPAGGPAPGALERAARLLGAVRVSGHDPLDATLAALAEHLVAHGVQLAPADPARRAQLDRLVSATGWGGPLAEFLAVPAIANIQVNGAGRDVILEYGTGGRDIVAGFGLSREWIEYLVMRWLAARRDPPARLPDIAHGSLGRMRFTYFGPVHALHGATLQIRRPLARPALDELVERGVLPAEAASVLRALVRARANLLVTGGTNAGKSTLVNALLAEIDPLERVGVVEAIAELDVSERPGTVAYEIGPAGDDEQGLARLLHANLYNSVTRLVLGEVRGGEAAQLLTALNSGVQGCIATIHAASADEAPRRLAQCARQSASIGQLTMSELCRMIAALELIVVHIALNTGPRGPQRRVTQIIEVYDALDDVFKRHELFRLESDGGLRWADPDLSEATWQRLQAEQVFLPVYGRDGRARRR
jgi:pilus assembly protein CpaF